MFGYELTDTVSVFTAEGIYIVASKKKVEFLKPAENVKESDCPFVKLITREKVSWYYFKKLVFKLKIKFVLLLIVNTFINNYTIY